MDEEVAPEISAQVSGARGGRPLAGHETTRTPPAGPAVPCQRPQPAASSRDRRRARTRPGSRAAWARVAATSRARAPASPGPRHASRPRERTAPVNAGLDGRVVDGAQAARSGWGAGGRGECRLRNSLLGDTGEVGSDPGPYAPEMAPPKSCPSPHPSNCTSPFPLFGLLAGGALLGPSLRGGEA